MKNKPNTPEIYMKKALHLARRGAIQGEVPVGAIVVKGDRVIGRGFNLREKNHRPTAHAEILAIEAAAKKLQSWRLEEATLYTTLEPCLMCWGALVLARIPKVVFGAKDPKAGVCGSVLSLHQENRFNHHPKVESGVMEEECGGVLSEFFLRLRGKIGHKT